MPWRNIVVSKKPGVDGKITTINKQSQETIPRFKWFSWFMREKKIKRFKCFIAMEVRLWNVSLKGHLVSTGYNVIPIDSWCLWQNPPTRAINLTKSTSDLEGYSFHFSMFGSRAWSCIAHGWLKIHPTRCFGRQSLFPFRWTLWSNWLGVDFFFPFQLIQPPWPDLIPKCWVGHLNSPTTFPKGRPFNPSQKGHDFWQNCQVLMVFCGFCLGKNQTQSYNSKWLCWSKPKNILNHWYVGVSKK